MSDEFDYNDPDYQKCIDDGLRANGIDRNTIIWGANSIKRQVIADCKGNFQDAASSVPSAALQQARDKGLWGDAAKPPKEEVDNIPNMSPGEVAGAIIQASKFGHMNQVKINPSNVGDIFKALNQSEELQQEYGGQLTEMLNRPNLYFENLGKGDLQRLAVEHMPDVKNEGLLAFRHSSMEELGIASRAGVGTLEIGGVSNS